MNIRCERACRCDEITKLTMRDIEGVGSANIAKVQDTNRDHSPFWESFTWKFAESTSDRMDSILDFTNIIETSSINNKGSRNY
jgi:hypothetical protein